MDDPLQAMTSPYDSLIGGELISTDPDAARLRLPVREELLQPFGIVHGGAFSSVIEGLCSVATFLAVYEDGMVAMGQSINVSFLRPISGGTANLEARARHRGRSTWVWECEIRDDDGKLCVLGQMTIAVRARPEGS
jgi:1,4-dihydroxy-2-naphthoyl-CoA hydrolase